ncbi:MAG: hypothetical protein M0010_15210 [Actinomycetota bacterium]|jgi:hypothetical protein|nr:hypothetical protein [Actinomycetota bacterium]
MIVEAVEVPAEPHLCVVRGGFQRRYIGIYRFRVECSVCPWSLPAHDEDHGYELADRHYGDEAASAERWVKLQRMALEGRAAREHMASAR